MFGGRAGVERWSQEEGRAAGRSDARGHGQGLSSSVVVATGKVCQTVRTGTRAAGAMSCTGLFMGKSIGRLAASASAPRQLNTLRGIAGSEPASHESGPIAVWQTPRVQIRNRSINCRTSR